MAFDPLLDEQPRRKPGIHELGQALDALSVDELEERIDLLQGEIERLRDMLRSKRASRDAASAFFKS
jgi:uncharacterized small protein (DUF1192 family)